MMAANCLMPNMPRLEMVKPPPWNSSSFSLPALARAARSFISVAICARPFMSALRTIGVIRPRSVATATEMSTAPYWIISSSVHEALHSG